MSTASGIEYCSLEHNLMSTDSPAGSMQSTKCHFILQLIQEGLDKVQSRLRKRAALFFQAESLFQTQITFLRLQCQILEDFFCLGLPAIFNTLKEFFFFLWRRSVFREIVIYQVTETLAAESQLLMLLYQTILLSHKELTQIIILHLFYTLYAESSKTFSTQVSIQHKFPPNTMIVCTRLCILTSFVQITKVSIHNINTYI
jgi:hypothetical protein